LVLERIASDTRNIDLTQYNSMNLKIEVYLLKFFKIVAVVSFIIGFFYMVRRPEGSGDELLFLHDLEYIKSNGWIEAIKKGISIPYMILCYPLSFILPNFIALRLVNVLIFIFLLVYFKKFGQIKNKNFYYYYLFFSARCWFLLGTNDTLFIVSQIVFFNEVYKILEKKDDIKLQLMWGALVISFFTRELALVYLPIVIIGIYLATKSKSDIFKNIFYPSILALVLIFCNLPSLMANHKFSFDSKLPPKEVQATWPQRQYLAQILVNEGKLQNMSHPSWEETDLYLEKNGKNSLPSSLSQSIFFNFKLTVMEFFKNFSEVLQDSVRQTGLITIIIFLIFFYEIFNKRLSLNLFLPFINILMVSIFSFIIISYVETRWLISVFILGILYFSDLEKLNKINRNLILTNLFVLVLISFYGIYKMMLKF